MEGVFLPDVPTITSPVPSYRSNLSENEQIPYWAREVAASLRHRPGVSRASSVISTRTKISTNTAREDACSVDLNIDGVYFRINRDGSRITTSEFRDTLPRYRPSLEVSGLNSGSGEEDQGQNGEDGQSVTTEMPDQRSEASHELLSPRLQHWSYDNHSGRLSSSPKSSLRPPTESRLSRNPSFTPGSETISVTKKRTVSENNALNVITIPRKPLDPGSRLHRRGGVRLPTLVTNLADGHQPRSLVGQNSAMNSSSPHCRYPHSADPTLGNDNHSFLERPHSPMFIGRNAPGLFPSPPRLPSSTRHPSLPDNPKTTFECSPTRLEEAYTDTYPPPPMESENDISMHYTRLIRTIDRDHRKVLHERDKEMATLRERLNEQDTVYRQQLRARDFIIDDLKSRIAHLETTTEARVEKACHSVEDVWENRWKDRDFHLMERMRRLEADLQLAVGRAVAERDNVWTKGWTTKYKQLIERLKEADQHPQHDLEQFDANLPTI